MHSTTSADTGATAGDDTRTAAGAAAEATAAALLNCLIREVCAPEQQVWPDEAHLVARLPRVGVTLRAALARPPVGATYRLAPPYEERRDGEWITARWDRLASLIAGELELATGRANPEFLGQVADSHAALESILTKRSAPAEPTDSGLTDSGPTENGPTENGPPENRYLDSEQSLIAGHRFHPSPKARQGSPTDWLAYAPEAGASFHPRWLAVRDDVLAQEGDPQAFAKLDELGPPPPQGHTLLPAHPWQLRLLAERPMLRRAFAAGLIQDLGPAAPDAFPTSSVRTAYLPAADVFCKFSLDVRITNCVRKNAWYELTGATVLNKLVGPVFDRLRTAASGGATFLAEPAYRSVALADQRLYEGLGVILRQGVGDLPGTPLLAAALTDPYSAHLATLPALETPDGAIAWWDAYVRHVAPPVLHAFFDHGIVLEPHLQNVLIAVDGDGMPVQAVFRDLEGTKLVDGRWDLSGLPAQVREAMTYDADRGWNRVVYCLLVNHLTEVAAAVADLHPAVDRTLWQVARKHFGHDRPEMRALLAGVPLPAKANLRARWARSADRGATYVPTPNPLAQPAPDLN
ncbi:IucA/IucC family protein [Actinomadura barringtoniae]|uniref:IucA/IucC family protein n=1 Tax=Actinomadura barringtoniae TaxID=1427535 RepID=A0A939TD22_9ACTN|nr:IucA/IucC family protein [Actinomadura barringtoniae]